VSPKLEREAAARLLEVILDAIRAGELEAGLNQVAHLAGSVAALRAVDEHQDKRG
jgi:hypothetical protein